MTKNTAIKYAVASLAKVATEIDSTNPELGVKYYEALEIVSALADDYKN